MADEKKMRSEEEIRARLEKSGIGLTRSMKILQDQIYHPLFPKHPVFQGAVGGLVPAICKKQGFIDGLLWALGHDLPGDDISPSSQYQLDGARAVAEVIQKHIEAANEEDKKKGG